MKVLGIYPHLQSGDTKMPHLKRYFPWGFATVLRCLEDDGHEVKVIDAYGDDLIKKEVIERLDREPFDCVCISGFASYNYSYVLWLADQIKRRSNAPVIVGGVLADLHYEHLLKYDTIDICAIGEGEETATTLLRNLDRLDKVKNIAYRTNKQINVNESKSDSVDLNSLPMPNFNLWNMKRYTKGDNLWVDDESTRAKEYAYLRSLNENSLRPNMSIFAGRGCPYRCRFCSRSYQTFRAKSVDRLISEMRMLIDEYHIKAFHFYDELLIYNKKRTFEFCDKVKQLNVYWDCQARVNTVNKEIFDALKNANCISVGLGLESGSNTILKAMNKGITREQSLGVLKAAKDAGFHLKLQFMFGYPGETKDTLKETISLLKEVGLPPRRLLWTTPLPGSDIYEDAKRDGLIDSEEKYLAKLASNMNRPGNIILNVSGFDDVEASKLYHWVHFRVEYNYLILLLKRNVFAFNYDTALSVKRLIRYFIPYVYYSFRELAQVILRLKGN